MDQNLLNSPQKKPTLLAPQSWTSSLHNCDDKFLFFKPLSLGYVVKAVLGNEHPNYSLSGSDVLRIYISSFSLGCQRGQGHLQWGQCALCCSRVLEVKPWALRS